MRARRIDHAVVAVHDLDRAGRFYESLGFQVGTRNRHPWGTENRLIQFESSFIELITVAPGTDAIPEHEERRFSFGAFVRDFLRVREGLAMLVLDSDDANADAALFSGRGIGSFEPFFFERTGRRPDGGETHVAFTLAFAVEAQAPEAGFFVCQQHHPENFWNPAFQRHDHGARDIVEVGLSAPDPKGHESFLAAFSNSSVHMGPDGSLSVTVRGGHLNVRADAGRPTLAFGSITVRVPDVDAQAARLAAARIPFVRSRTGLAVPAHVAHGLEIRFEAPLADRLEGGRS